MTREEMIAEAMPLVKWQAKRFPRLPRGLNSDDLESAGHEALLDAVTTFDPVAGGWITWARTQIKFAMKKAIKQASSRRHQALQPVVDGEELPPPVDPRAKDPAEIAAAREIITRPHARIEELSRQLPSPAAVADRVTQLRAAMFGAVSQEDVADVMQTVVRSAKDGDLRAARILIDLLGPGRSGVKINQQAIVVHTGDIS